MDRSWINLHRSTPEYLAGVNNFLDFAFCNASVNGKIQCPCPKCNFKKWHPKDVVREHLIFKPFPREYVFWQLHGERPDMIATSTPRISRVAVQAEQPDAMNEAVRDAFGVHGSEERDEVEGPEPEFVRNETAREFFDLMNEADKPLYPGCAKYSKLSFLVKLYHIKCLCGMTEKVMSMVLELLGDAFPQADFPPSFYEAKKIISKLGLDYKKIDACPNDCMLYWGEDENSEICKRCKTSRYKSVRKGKKEKKKPAKILRYNLIQCLIIFIN